MNYKKLIEKICYAAIAGKDHLVDIDKYNKKKYKIPSNMSPQKFKQDTIKKFQKKICRYLNNKNNKYYSYKWQTETPYEGRGERVDIMGTPTQNSNKELTCIIEIDACREDQVAAKILSRLALWGMNEPIIYVALLYYKKKKSISIAKNYVRFATDVIKKIKRRSIVVGLYIDVHDRYKNPLVEVWDYNNKNNKGPLFKTKFEITDSNGNNVTCDSMSNCASEAIKLISTQKKINMKHIETEFRKFVNRKIHLGKNWNQFEQQAYWTDFVDFCKNKGYSIVEKVPCYVKEWDKKTRKWLNLEKWSINNGKKILSN